MLTNALANNNISPLAEIYAQYPFDLVAAEDVFVYDKSGRKYLDLYGGHAVCALGHNPKAVLDAVLRQGQEFLFYSNLARIPIRERAAEKLLEFSGGYFDRAFFCNSGGEANENALKIALKITGKSKLIGFRGGFHGRTLLAMSVTDKPEWHAYLKERVGNSVLIGPNDPTGLDTIDHDTAAVILEPIQSIGGVVEFTTEYLTLLRKRCDQVGALLIFDEVQTGMGRTGVPFVSGSSGVVPDMMTSAKALGGGFPIGAVLMREEIHQELKIGDLGATFGGGPLALAAMEATIEAITKDNLMKHVCEVSAYAKQALTTIPSVKEIRGRGFLLGILLDREAKEVQKQLFAVGIITGTCSHKNVLHLLPPFTLNIEHVDQLRQALMRC